MNDRTPDDRTPDDELLAGLIDEWKAATPAPPAHLEHNILQAVRAEGAAEAGQQSPAPELIAAPTPRAGRRADAAPRWYLPTAWPRPVWAAAGAFVTLLVVLALFAVRAATLAPAPTQANRLLVAEALREAEAAEREHARAIARLQQTAQPILMRVSDPTLSGEHAARLMMLSDRLRFLDQTIAEIQNFLRENPAHPGARTTLLAAYTDKTQVLRDVLALDQEISS